MFVVDHLVGQAARLRAREASADVAARGQELASLDCCDLRDRFYSWRDAAGQRFICSIFLLHEEDVVADFSQAVIIGVAREGATRRPICLLSSCEFETAQGRNVRAAARAIGVNEWHVRFGAGNGMLRGLAAALLN